ncbi:bifunctional metallophosphatase/5'-nucleotidase [Polaribacter sp. Asnod1-A03]|uniref:bifunctional metallophosphatase/5'-nucleotidase n=1 Tax=Polaribacter sp. Asnod1-A03 TaxID=3160581 RepID=UPI0038675943
MKNRFIFLITIVFLIAGCSKNEETPIIKSEEKKLTIFFINDQHGQLDNFSKIKHIVDLEKENTNVITVCSGDIFSGNPVVDNHPQKGFPMIDVMNRAGFDLSVLGNHEFDYGELILTDRMDQANFEWVCANVDMSNSGVPDPFEYQTISVEDIKVTFLGLVETNGSNTETIPSTHPWRVKNLAFERPENVIEQYKDIKTQENSDLYIALTHLGFNGGSSSLGDTQIAEQYPYFDLIIGGHSHQEINTIINDIPIFQSGANLNNLGKIELTIKDQTVQAVDYELIDLNTYAEFDTDLKTIIDDYNDLPYLNEVIGYSHLQHAKSKVGCFYTDALKGAMNVDVTFQNTGGIRSTLNKGDITNREIFEISPFNNSTVIYEMTVTEIKNFLKGSSAGFYYSGIYIEQNGDAIEIKDLNDNIIPDTTILSVGTNDYIPAVYSNYFPTDGEVQLLTDAETVISYLQNDNDQVNYPNCDQYFNYQ